jgi:hypothetical protein
VLDEALKLHNEAEIMMIAMVVSLADEDGEAILREAIRRASNLIESPEMAVIASAIADGGYNFSW